MSGDHENCDKVENPLKNWSSWTQEWRKVQSKLAEKLHLEPGNLLVNYSEGLRNINEEKQVLDSAKIPTEFDKYRGKPDFWRLPFALPRKHPCCPCEPDYFAVKTKKEGYEIPPIDHIGVPTEIRTEKNILNGTRNIYLRWQNSQYRYEQFVKWAKKVEHIVPHWPDLEHLVVIGSKIAWEEPTDQVDVASLTKQVSEVEIKEVTKVVIKEAKRLDLKINGLDVGQDHGTRKIWLNFELDLSSDESVSQCLIFDNCGLATMRVSFEKLERFRLFRDVEEASRKNFGFYFDRKQVVILPGMRATIPIWFTTDRPGTYSENWEIFTQPALWSDDFHLILVLNSYSYFKDLQEKIDTTLKYIEIQARNLLIKNLLDDCLKTIHYKETPTQVCVYGEKELFELANFSNGRPQFLYDEKLVTELKQIYDQVESSGKWDFSVCNLTKLAHRKDTIIYLDNKMLELVEHILRIEKEAQEPPKIEKKVKEKKVKEKKSDKKSAKKTKSSKSSTSQHIEETTIKPKIKPEPYEYSNQSQVWEVVRKLDSPVIINTQREKYFTCHSVLSSYFDKMCYLLNELELEIGLSSTRTYPRVKNKLLPINKLPERLVYEYFEHHYIPTVPIREIYPYDAKRKPKILKEVASDDAEALYSIYFNKTIGETEKKKGKSDKEKKKKGDKDKKKKDKGGNKEKKEKTNKTDKGKKKKKVESKENIKKEISVESFNPYKEQFFYVSESEDEVVDNRGIKKEKLSKDASEDYKYKQYLIVYSCLENAVDALVDTLESFECVVSYPTLNEVKPQDQK